MRDISFVVLNYNDAMTTITLVDSLCTWTLSEFNMHVIIVDNMSVDNSFAVLREHYNKCERVDVIVSERNGGYSYGNNYGCQYAIKWYHSDYIAIANPDIRIDELTVAKLLDTFALDDTIAICAPVMVGLDGKFKVYSQQLPSYVDDLKACFSDRVSSTINTDNPLLLDGCSNRIVTQMLPGSFFVARSDYFLEIGMLDDNVFLFCEERILGNRIKKRGWKEVLCSDLFFVHAHSVSIKKNINTINTVKILHKSRLYYEETYNHVNKGKLLVLKIAMCFYVKKVKLYQMIMTTKWTRGIVQWIKKKSGR